MTPAAAGWLGWDNPAFYREYRDGSNVGYGTLLAEFYLVIIIIFVTALLSVASRRTPRVN